MYLAQKSIVSQDSISLSTMGTQVFHLAWQLSRLIHLTTLKKGPHLSSIKHPVAQIIIFLLNALEKLEDANPAMNTAIACSVDACLARMYSAQFRARSFLVRTSILDDNIGMFC